MTSVAVLTPRGSSAPFFPIATPAGASSVPTRCGFLAGRASVSVRASARRRAKRLRSRAMRLSARVLRWYSRHARDLPWRRTRDPYAVLVSEVMLQQTQVSRVLPAYERFLRRFPTLGVLARAPLGDVL